MPQIAKVAVSAANYAIDKPYDYLLPDGTDAAVGSRVLVPFGRGNRLTEGMILSLERKTPEKGIALSNGVGVIDSDYRGEVGMGLINLSDEPYTIQPGDRVAQMMISPVILPALRFVDELDETARGAGGLGSTGR